MNALESRFGSGLLWLLAFGAVAAIVGWETDWGRHMSRAPTSAPLPAPQPVEIALLPEYQIEGGLAGRQETVERPAFMPTRRPAPTPVQEAPKPRIQRGQFTLTGTAVVDQKSIAFLRENAGGKSRTVRAGETINGLTVAEVGRDRVKLALGEETEELVLKVAAGPRTTIQPPQLGVPVPGAQVPGRATGPGPLPTGPAGPAVAGQPAPMDSDQSILERRRAARAQAAAEAAGRAGITPQSNAPVSPTAVLPSAAGSPPATPSPPDPAWAEVYRRMQQPRR